MFDPRLIDVAIGMILLFLLVSLLVTIVQEAIASLFKLRARNLRAAIANLLGEARARRFYRHPLIAGLYRVKPGVLDTPTRRLPSYIPDRTFVLALLDVLRQEADPAQPPALAAAGSPALGGARLLEGAPAIIARMAVAELPSDQRLRQVLALLVGNLPADTTGPAVGAALEQWFNDAMDRAGGWYKRQAQLLSVLVGFGVAAFTNGDAIHVAKRLWTDAGLRAAASAAASVYQRDSAGTAGIVVAAGSAAAAAGPGGAPADRLARRLDANLSAIEASTLPVGWMRDPQQNCVGQFCSDRGLPPGSIASIVLLMLAGWGTTALATSLGAPFWFDLLSKALQVRSTGSRVRTDSDPDSKR
jgi:hypothetical protein